MYVFFKEFSQENLGNVIPILRREVFMQLVWKKIKNFPTYEISSEGDVVNIDTGRYLRKSTTLQGAVKVGMVRAGVQYTKSVKVLVAEAFVPGRSDIFDTPIHLDGNTERNHADNLMWRPRWFAYRYTRQFVEPNEFDSFGPIEDLTTGIIYDTVLDASIHNGLLVEDIIRGIRTDETVFPTWQLFAYVVNS